MDRDRSRSPLRDAQPATLAGRVVQKAQQAALTVATAAANRMMAGRGQAILKSVLVVMSSYIANRNDLERLGVVMCDEIERLGGLVRKVAQQLSQLPNIVTSAALRRGMQGLQSRNQPRAQCEIEQQLRSAFPDAKFEVTGVCGTGCMGEVSKVRVHSGIDGVPAGTLCAVKTVNLQQRELFNEDFALFARFSELMKPMLTCLRVVNADVAERLDALVSKITDISCKEELVSSIRGGFNLESEADNMEEASEVLRKIGDGFAIPHVYAVSKYVLLMEHVEGRLLEEHTSSEVPSEFVQDFVTLYVMMFIMGYLHQDLHPANLFILPQSKNKPKVSLIDWGEVVRVPEMHRNDALVLLKTIVAGRWMGTASDSLPELCQRLGIEEKPGREINEDTYHKFINMLSLDVPLRGDSQQSSTNLIGASNFQAPGWYEAWFKASRAVAVSLKAAGASPESVDGALRAALELQ